METENNEGDLKLGQSKGGRGWDVHSNKESGCFPKR